MIDKPTMTVEDIKSLGFTKWTSYNILRQAKAIMVERGFDFYNNKGLGTVPTHVVEEIIGAELLNNG